MQAVTDDVQNYIVLILVLVEDGLGDQIGCDNMAISEYSLNPCFSGGWSRSNMAISEYTEELVLILVLVEDGLGEGL